MVERDNDEERRLRIQTMLRRLVTATTELEALKRPKAIVELQPLAPRDPHLPPRKWDRL
jgi:hypothetical protein